MLISRNRDRIREQETGSGPLRDDWGWLEPPEVGSLSLKSAIEVRISRLDFLGV
jgi:hypothetical protein